MKLLLFLWTVCTIGFPLGAQTKFKVWGTVYNQDSIAMINAFVKFQAKDSTIATSITNEKGYFETFCPKEVDQIVFSYIGGKHTIPLTTLEKDINLGNFYIPLKDNNITTIEVTGRRPLVRYQGGKVIYNINALPNIEGANILEAIEKIPSLQYRPEQGFLLNGFEKLMVVVDKRPLRLTNQQIENYLNGIAAENIASVELIQNPGELYGSKGLPVLNIVTKKAKEDGYNLYASVKGVYQYFVREKTNLQLNFNKGTSRSYLSYAFADDRYKETTDILGAYTNTTEILPRRSHQVSLGTFLLFNEKQSLDINLYGVSQREHFLQDKTISSNLNNHRLFTSLQHIFQYKALEVRTTAEASLAHLSQTSSTTVSLNQKENLNFVRLAPTLNYAVSNKGNLTAGLSYEYVSFQNKLTNTAVESAHEEQQACAFLGYNHTLGKVYLQGNLSAELYQLQYNNNRKTDFVLLPSFSVNYQPFTNHLFSLETRSSYTRPDFRDVTPIKTQSTTQWLRDGNPYLRPSQNYTTTLRYTFMQAALLEVSYSHTKDPIVEEADDSSGAITLFKNNLAYQHYLRYLAVLPVPLVNKKSFNWFATTTGALQSQLDKGKLKRGYDLHQKFTTYYLQHRHDLTLASTWSVGLSATFYGKLYYELYHMKPTWWLEASVSKRMGDWRVAVNVRDPWNTNKAEGEYAYLNTPFSFERSWHSPQLSLTISYSFGNKSLKRYQERYRSDASSRMRDSSNEGVAKNAGF